MQSQRTLWLSLAAIWCLSGLAHAQTVPTSEEPGREAERFAEPLVPLAAPAGSPISLVEETAVPSGADTITLTIAGFEVVGSTAYGSAVFAAITDDLIGPDQPLVAVYEAARRITALYGNDGFILSRAIVPPQDLDPSGAVVTLHVIEGYVDQVIWPPELDRYRDLFSGYAAIITAERPSNIHTVTRYLLLAGDLPGIDVRSRFEAGTTDAGASTLVVESASSLFDATLRIDNRGTEARGPFQYAASASVHNLLGIHESFTLTYGGSFDFREMQFVSGRYTQVLTSEGATASFNVSYSLGEPGTAALQALDFQTRSFSADVGLRWSLVRAREANITPFVTLFGSESTAYMLGTVSSFDALRGVRAGVTADWADRFNGVTQISLVLTQGIDAFGSSGNDNPLASRGNGRAQFFTVSGGISRLQPLGGGYTLRLAAEGQWSPVSLLAPAECTYGGGEFGRAFDSAELTGDRCASASLEFRYAPLLSSAFLTQLQVYGFADVGTVHRIAPAAGVASSATGSSAGLGVSVGFGNRMSADLSAAKPLIGRADDGWRFFFSASLRFAR